MKTIGIIGSRRRARSIDYQAVEDAFWSVYEDGDRIVSGGCSQGGDLFAETIARKFQITILIHYARWSKLGRGAGFARNGDIARDADVLIASAAHDRTGGIEDTIKKYEKLGKTQLILV